MLYEVITDSLICVVTRFDSTSPTGFGVQPDCMRHRNTSRLAREVAFCLFIVNLDLYVVSLCPFVSLQLGRISSWSICFGSVCVSLQNYISLCLFVVRFCLLLVGLCLFEVNLYLLAVISSCPCSQFASVCSWFVSLWGQLCICL